MLPVVAIRVPEGRVGSTLVMRLLASSPEVATERGYPAGERRYLSYCAKAAAYVCAPWRSDVDPGVTEMFFGEDEQFGPLPFAPEILNPDDLRSKVLAQLWEAFSASMLAQNPSTRLYAEKLAVSVDPLVEAGIGIKVIDCIRDPRDVLASIRAFVTKTGVNGFEHREGERDREYLDRFLERFDMKLGEWSATPKAIDRVVVRYEDLVADFEGVAALLGEWLHLPLDPTIDDRSRAEDPDHLTSASPSASVGRWKRDLPPLEAEKIWTALGPRLSPFGYAK